MRMERLVAFPWSFGSLIIIVTVKYAFFVLRADNRGEGGILALMSLTKAKWRGKNRYLLVIGLVGRGAFIWRRDYYPSGLSAQRR